MYSIYVRSLVQKVFDTPLWWSETLFSSHKPLYPGDLTPLKWVPRRLYSGVSVGRLGPNFRQGVEYFLDKAPYVK